MKIDSKKNHSDSRKIAYIKQNWILYVILAPTILYFIIFRVLPIINMRLAFFDYRANGEWVFQGSKYFRIIFSTPLFKNILLNTITISFLKYILLFPFFIMFALFLNEIRVRTLKNSIQVISYLPHFFSWVIIAGIWTGMLAPSGVVNEIRSFFGLEAVDFLTSKDHILGVLFFSEMWRSIGWDSIIFIVAINTIPNDLYESAFIDGVSKLQSMFHITLPCLVPAIITVFILNLGFFLNAGLDQVFNFANPAVLKRIDIIDTYIYRVGIMQGSYSLGTALGLLKGFLGMILVVVTHYISKKYSGDGVW